MATTWITVVTLVMAMTLTMTSVKSDISLEKYTTVPPEKQAELEKLDLDTSENVLDDFSGDVDPGLEAKVNKTKFTTPRIQTTNEVQETEAVGGVFNDESTETTTESEEGSGDIDIFATQFPQNVQHALNETKDEELLPASEATTAATTKEEFIAPVLVNRKPVQSRPEEDEQTTTLATPDDGKQAVLKDETVVAPVAELDVKSSNLHDVNDAGELKPADEPVAEPSDDNPSAQTTKGSKPLSRGVIVGIVIIGVILLLALIIALVYLLVFRPRRKALKHNVDADMPAAKENGQIANGAPKNNEESMTALVKELKDNKLSAGKDKTYGTELKDDMEDVKLNGSADNKGDSPV